jgi:GNAT superfamily N-acetyltransferase
MKIDYQIIEKKDLIDDHRSLFASMLAKQNRVNGNLFSKADRCKFICIAKVGSKPVGIGAIKKVTKSDFDVNKANLPDLRNDFKWELGYIFVSDDFSNNGIASTIVKELLTNYGNRNLISTTEVAATPGMVKILTKNGFKEVGKRWKSSITLNQLGLFIKYSDD